MYEKRAPNGEHKAHISCSTNRVSFDNCSNIFFREKRQRCNFYALFGSAKKYICRGENRLFRLGWCEWGKPTRICQCGSKLSINGVLRTTFVVSYQKRIFLRQSFSDFCTCAASIFELMYAFGILKASFHLHDSVTFNILCLGNEEVFWSRVRSLIWTSRNVFEGRLSLWSNKSDLWYRTFVYRWRQSQDELSN